MAGRRLDQPLWVSLFAFVLSLIILVGVFVGGRLTDTAQALTGDLGSWTSTIPLTTPTWAFAAAASNSYVYISGGETTGGLELTGTMRAAINPDGTLGSWQDQTLISTPRIDHGMVYTETATGNRCLYVVGGYVGQDTKVTNTVEFATVGSDGSVEAWAPATGMNSNRTHFGTAVYGGRIYSLGGIFNNSGAATSTVEFAPINSGCSLGAWQTTTAMTSTHSGNRAFAAGGYLYSTGDFSNTLASGVQYAPINPDTGAVGDWSSTIPMNQKRSDHAVIANTRAGYVYALGGMGQSGPLNSAERAPLNPDGTLGAWGFITSLPAASEDMAFAQANGRVYLLGGYSESITNTVIFSTIEGAGTPDLSTSAKRVSASSASPGQAITYTIVLTNTGNGSASALVTDTLPLSVTYVPGSATGAAAYVGATRAITWGGTVAAGSAVTITYSGVITSPLNNGTAITNTASINDGASVPFDTAPVTTTISSDPDLSTSRETVNKAISSPGGTVGYSIVVNNTGTMSASARVTDTLPVSVTYISNTLQSTMGASTYDASSGTINWTGPALVGVPVTISFQARLLSSLASGAFVTDTATVQAAGRASMETSLVTVTVVSNPSRIGWTNLGLYGAIVSDIAVDPVNGVVYQSGSANPGVYRTANGGESWMPTSLPSNCGPVAVERSSGVTYVNCQQNLWKSTDAGVSWTNVLTRSMSQSGFQGIGWGGAIVVTATTLYVGDSQGNVWKSEDAGTTWNKRGTISQGTNVRRLALHPANVLELYATSETKVYKSSDGGASWTDITPTGDTDFLAVGVSPFNSSLLFVGTSSSRHLWKSTDGGASWTDTHAFGGGWIKFHPTDPSTIYASGVSHDAGTSWQTIAVAGGGMDIDPRNPNVIYANSDHGVQKSTDGGATWTEINTGLEEVPIDDVAQNPQDPNHFFVGSRTGRGRSFDGGVNWTWPLAGGAGFAVAMDPSNVYVADNGLDKSTDGGRTWTASNLRTVQEADLGGGRSAQIHQIDVVPGDSRHVFAALAEPPPPGVTPKGGVYESTDGGLTWAATGLRDLPVNAMGFGATANGTIIYAGIGDQWNTPGIAAGVYTSTVGNTSVWTRTSLTNTYVWKLRVDPTNPLVAYAGGHVSEGGEGPKVTALYKTTDGGATWADLLPAAPRENALRAIAIDPVHPNNVFYSAASRIYQSVDGGTNWRVFADTDMGGEGINALLVPLAAPSPVVTFTATISGSQASLSWSNPSDSDFVGVTVKYSTMGFPMLSTEGITLTTASGLPEATGVYTHTGVISGTTYYYSAFSYNQAGRYSLPFQAAANSSAAAFASGASELPARSLAAAPRRPAAQAGTRNLYAAAGAGLFSTEIEAATSPTPTPSPTPSSGQKIYFPFLAKNHAAGW